MPTEFPLTYLDAGQVRVGLEAEGRQGALQGTAGLRATIETVQALEQAGFARYWLGEHHVEWNFHSAPEVLLPILATQTRTLRIGTAGVLMPYARPFKVAEQFRALSSWFPGRLDLGMAKGPGAEPGARRALGAPGVYTPTEFQRDVQEVDFLLEEGASPKPAPSQPGDLQLWCHTSNPQTMEVAAQRGMGLGLGIFLMRDKSTSALKALGKAVDEHYYSRFEPSRHLREPAVSAVEFMMTWDDPTILAKLKAIKHEEHVPMIGTPVECIDYARMMLDATNATEFGFFQAPFHVPLVRRTGQLLAEAAGNTVLATA